MKALRIHGYASDPVLNEIAVPEPAAGEVRVRTAAASFNFLDVKLQRGQVQAFFPLAFPYTLGTDLSGTLDAVGPGVGGWAIGDRVMARNAPEAGGAIAEFTIVPADQLVALPEAMTFEDAAGIPTAAVSAWQALFEIADLRSGQTVLVHGGAGGVGSFAVQFARAAGARVIATASGAGIAIVERLGADTVIDYRSEDFAARVTDADVVLDTIGGDTQERSFGVLRNGGFLVTAQAPPDAALAKAHGVETAFLYHTSDAARLATVVAAMAGSVRVLTDRVVPLADATRAFAHQASGTAKGKIIVHVAP